MEMIQPLHDKYWQKPRRKAQKPKDREMTLQGLNARLKLAEAQNERLMQRLIKLEMALTIPQPENGYLPLDIDITGQFFYREEL